jgi:hypothetical protein
VTPLGSAIQRTVGGFSLLLYNKEWYFLCRKEEEFPMPQQVEMFVLPISKVDAHIINRLAEKKFQEPGILTMPEMKSLSYLMESTTALLSEEEPPSAIH